MKCLLILAALAFGPFAANAAEPLLKMPKFPLPELVRDDFGEAKRMGFLRFFRELSKGGIQEFDDVELVDTDYAMLKSDSLATLVAWLEAACHSVGLELPQARKGNYDGAVYARLLEVATSLAALREHGQLLAMPIGVLMCKREQTWGKLPSDGALDAYVLVATERGLLIYDPPTRQLTTLSDFPNTSGIFKIQF